MFDNYVTTPADYFTVSDNSEIKIVFKCGFIADCGRNQFRTKNERFKRKTGFKLNQKRSELL